MSWKTCSPSCRIARRSLRGPRDGTGAWQAHCRRAPAAAGGTAVRGHFPGRAIMPGVLITEALAQTSGLLLGLSEKAAGAAPPQGPPHVCSRRQQHEIQTPRHARRHAGAARASGRKFRRPVPFQCGGVGRPEFDRLRQPDAGGGWGEAMKALLLRGNPRKTGYTSGWPAVPARAARDAGRDHRRGPRGTAYSPMPGVLSLPARHAGAVRAFGRHGRAFGAGP